MQAVKILFKSIELSKDEEKKILDFFSKHNGIEFHYYVIFDEKEHINSVRSDINIWIVDKYDENQSDNYHCVIRFYTLEELFEEFETLIEEIKDIFIEDEEPSISIENSILNNTTTKKYNIDTRGKGELDINYKAGSVEEDREEIKKRLEGNKSVIQLNPYKDLFK